MGKVSFHLAPVVDHMISELKTSNKLFAGETRCPVLDPGRGVKPKQVISGLSPAMSVPLAARHRLVWSSAMRMGVAVNMQVSF
jgi:hypothetical protein